MNITVELVKLDLNVCCRNPQHMLTKKFTSVYICSQLRSCEDRRLDWHARDSHSNCRQDVCKTTDYENSKKALTTTNNMAVS